MALPHAYGRLQFGEDLELTFRTLAGVGRNPNISAAVVIGIEPNWTERIVKEIRKTGKLIAGFSIERFGDLKTIFPVKPFASFSSLPFVKNSIPRFNASPFNHSPMSDHC